MPGTQARNEPVDPTILDLSGLDDEPVAGEERIVVDEDDQQPGEAPHLVEDPGEADGGAVEARKREAVEMGWAPKDKWRGKPEAWVDYDTFLRRGEVILPIVQKDLRSAREEAKRLREQLSARDAEFVEFKKFMTEQNAARDLAATAQLKAERLAALEANDLVRLNEIDIALQDRRMAPKPVDNTAQVNQQEAVRILNDFVAEGNTWVRDEANQRRINMIGNELRAAGETATGRRFLDIVKEEMVARYPALFRTNGNGRGSNIEMNGTPGRSGTGARHSYENLKPEYKEQADKFDRSGSCSKKEYVENCGPDAFRS